MKKKFEYEFELNTKDKISLEYSENSEEQLRIENYEGLPPTLSLNRDGCLFLAKILIKMALGNYSSGFHLHLHEDLDANKEEVLIIGITNK